MFISGLISQIPIKISRKKAKDSVKNNLRNNITVKPIGDGDYYGFTIDGNRRFLLEDFTVTHNTTFALNLALNMVGPGLQYDIIYYACEISQDLALMRALCHLGKVDMDQAYESPQGFKEHVHKAVQSKVAGTLLFKSFASKSTTIGDIRAHARTAIKQLDIRPKMIVIDYAETVKPTERGKESDYRQQANISPMHAPWPKS